MQSVSIPNRQWMHNKNMVHMYNAIYTIEYCLAVETKLWNLQENRLMTKNYNECRHRKTNDSYPPSYVDFNLQSLFLCVYPGVL